LKAKEDAIRNDYLYYRSSITDAIDRFDKSDEEVSEDLINFLRSTTDISETAREQFLKLLMS
jgi:chaperone required for assembly of F1-ATPase